MAKKKVNKKTTPGRVAAARVRATERKTTKLTIKQERFIEHYAKNNDKEDALAYAGYSTDKIETMYTQVSRLLNNPKIRARIDEIRAKIASEYGMNREGVMNRLKMIYLEACEDRDWAAAANALDKLAKIFGAYEENNRQKRYSAEDVAAIKARLIENGVDFTEVNKPKVLPAVGGTPGKPGGFVVVEAIPQENGHEVDTGRAGAAEEAVQPVFSEPAAVRGDDGKR